MPPPPAHLLICASSPIGCSDATGLKAGAGTISSAQLGYARSHCERDCFHDNPFIAILIGGQEVLAFVTGQRFKETVEEQLEDQMHAVYAEANRFATSAIRDLRIDNTERNHAALRHCYASAKYSTILGCACAGCLGHYRAEYELLYENDPLSRAKRTDYNNGIGRICANCSGKSRLSGTANATDKMIADCCKAAYRDGRLDLGGHTGGRKWLYPIDTSPVYFTQFPVPPDHSKDPAVIRAKKTIQEELDTCYKRTPKCDRISLAGRELPLRLWIATSHRLRYVATQIPTSPASCEKCDPLARNSSPATPNGDIGVLSHRRGNR